MGQRQREMWETKQQSPIEKLPCKALSCWAVSTEDFTVPPTASSKGEFALLLGLWLLG